MPLLHSPLWGLTPEFGTRAQAALTNVETHGLVVPVGYGKDGSPAGRSLILKPGDGAVGLQGTPAVEGEDVAGSRPVPDPGTPLTPRR